MRIRAAILDRMGLPRPYSLSRPVAIETVELDPPGPGEVLVCIAAAGLCHSDLSVVNGDRPRPMPLALGHESAGIVAECGAGVVNLARGDHVALVFVPSCGHCLPCLEGRPALCEPGAAANTAGTLVGGHRRLRRHDGSPLHYQVGVSCFAEFAVVARGSLVRLDPGLPLDVAAIFGCAVLTGAGAVINAGRVPLGASVAIVGLGGVGLSALLAALACGARQVVAVDLLDTKLLLARELGATHVFSAADPQVASKVREATGGGADYAFEMASAVDALALAYNITRRGGTTVTASLPPPSHHFPLPAVNLVAEERTLKGCYLGSAVPARDIPRYAALHRAGRLPVERLVTQRIALDSINEAFDRLADGEAVRQVIVFRV